MTYIPFPWLGVAGGGYTPTVIVTNQTELNTELAKSAAALDQAVNISAVGSGYVDYDARTINEAME